MLAWLLCPPRPRLTGPSHEHGTVRLCNVSSLNWLNCGLFKYGHIRIASFYWWRKGSGRDCSSCLRIRLNKWDPNYLQLGPTLTEGATASLSDDWRWEANYNEKRQKVPVFKHEYPSPHIYKEGPFFPPIFLLRYYMCTYLTIAPPPHSRTKRGLLM